MRVRILSGARSFAGVAECIRTSLRDWRPKGIAGSCPVTGTYATDHLLRRDGDHDSGKVAPTRCILTVKMGVWEASDGGSTPLTSTVV